MGLAYFVVVNPCDPSFRGFLKGGKALAGGEVLLADLARQIGVRPLSAFLSGDPEMIAAELEEFERETGVTVPSDAKPSSEQWFTPQEGVATVERLLESVRGDAGGYPSGLDRALSELLQVLEGVGRLGIAWHLDLA